MCVRITRGSFLVIRITCYKSRGAVTRNHYGVNDFISQTYPSLRDKWTEPTAQFVGRVLYSLPSIDELHTEIFFKSKTCDQSIRKYIKRSACLHRTKSEMAMMTLLWVIICSTFLSPLTHKSSL